jgi:hypothetical protein
MSVSVVARIAAITSVTLCLMTAAPLAAMTYVVESRPGGQNYAQYSETGSWGSSTGKSEAAGCTSGIGSRWCNTYRSSVGEKHAVFSAVDKLPASGTYNVYATWCACSNRRAGIQYVVTHDGGQTAMVVDQSATGDTWVLLGQFTFTAGTGSVDVNNTQVDVSGYMYADAVGWELVSSSCDLHVSQVGVHLPALTGDLQVTVIGVDPAATKVSIYADLVKIGENPAPAGASEVVVDVDMSVLPAGLAAGTRIAASQTMIVDGEEKESCPRIDGPIAGSCSQVPAVTVAGTYIPPGNILFSPVLLAGDTRLVVSGVSPHATLVRVYANSLPIGSANPAGAALVDVQVPSLVSGNTITATQVLPGVAQPALSMEGCIPATGAVVNSAAQVPAVRLIGMVDAGRTKVRVTDVSPYATNVKVYAGSSTLIGTNNTLDGAGTVTVNVTPLVEGQTIKAVQTSRIDGTTPTAGRRVMATNVVEDFDGIVTLAYTPALTGSTVYGAWYLVAPNACTSLYWGSTRAMLFGSKCLDITSNYYTNGAYAIFEQVVPGSGTYHLEVDMLIDEPTGSDYDFHDQYQVGVIVNGQHCSGDGRIASITAPVGTYRCLTPQQDGTTETQALKIQTGNIVARAGDDLLVAFSTDVNTYTSGKGSAQSLRAGMKIDNIKLVPGPQDLCLVPPLTAVATALSPLEAGNTSVSIGAAPDPAASQIRVYADHQLIGTANPAQLPAEGVHVAPLVAGTKIQVSQVIGAWESCLCSNTGVVVGTGRNSPLKVTLGIRETGGTGPIGTNGGASGPIEWVGAATVTNLIPDGKPLYPNAGWQEVTFAWPAAGGTDPVRAFTGNGVLDGTWGTLESFAFKINSDNSGRYVVYIDSIRNGDTVIADFDSLTPGQAGMFRHPSYSGSTSKHLLAYPNVAEVVATAGADGSRQSSRVEFRYKDNDPQRWIRLTTYDGTDTDDMPVQNPMIDLTKPVTVKFRLYGPDACANTLPDVDTDGDVDLSDFAAVQRCLTTGGRVVSPECACFDHVFDDAIDAQDVAWFIDCANGPNLAPNAGCLE